MERSCCFWRLAIASLLLSSDWLRGIRSESTTTTTTAESHDSNETHSSIGTDKSPSTPDATTTATDGFYCDDSYSCEDPFTMNSGLSLVDDSTPCACRSSYMNTGKCCLSQWWIIGLASAAGAVVLVAFIAGVGCCCSYKAKAKRATIDAQTAQQLSRKLQEDLDRMESEVIERSSSVNRDVAKTTVPGHSDPAVTQSAVHSAAAAAAAAAPVAAAAAAAAAASHASSEHHVTPDAHSVAHSPHPGVNHSVGKAPAAAAAAQDARRHDNNGIGHNDVTTHSEQRSNAGQLHRHQGHDDAADGFHDLSHSPEPDYSRHYDNSRRRTPRPVTDSSFVDPYYGSSRTNPVYADDDDNDSLEAYDDTAPPTRNNYNYYGPTTAYNNHHVINRPSFSY